MGLARGGWAGPRNRRLARTRGGESRNSGLGKDFFVALAAFAGLAIFARAGFFPAAGFLAGRGFFFLILRVFAMAGHARESAEKRQG